MRFGLEALAPRLPELMSGSGILILTNLWSSGNIKRFIGGYLYDLKG
jgi:hypothetical protein